jgi:hypothetical protein
MTKPVIITPGGQGGHWISNLCYSLENKNYSTIPAEINFHKHTQSENIIFTHVGLATGPVTGSFCGSSSQFIAYLNTYYKWYLYKANQQPKTEWELIYDLSNDAKWRQDINNGSLFSQQYLNNIVLDADLMFTNPPKFAEQLFALLDKCQVPHVANLDFVLDSIDNFKQTCWTLDKIDISNSSPWLAWCHAMCLLQDIPIPMNIVEKFKDFSDWVVSKEHWFLEETNKQFITHI